MADNTKTDRPAQRPGRASLTPEAFVAALDEPLKDETKLLEVLVQGLAAGASTPDMFHRLHEAAVRDDRVANLSFAYERLAREGRVKTLPKPRQAELFYHAATFFADVFGDTAAAIPYAERAMALAPDDAYAFERLESLLITTRDGARLTKLYASVTQHRHEPEDKLALLRRAIDVLEACGASQQAPALHEQIVTIEPNDPRSFGFLEQLYASNRRFRELAKLLEDSFTKGPPLDPAIADDRRMRLIALYRGELRDPQKASPHVEVLLARDPVIPTALQAAEALLDHRALAPKLAPVLSDVYRRLGRSEDEATTLALELKLARPPRLAEVHRRLAMLRQDVLGDPAGALELLEPLVSRDPSDDELRRRYLDVCATFHRQIDAARLLTRALGSAKDPEARARVGLEIARLYIHEGEAARAQAALLQVVQSGASAETRLKAARQLIELHEKTEDVKALAGALELVIKVDPEMSNRIPAAKRLAELCEGPVKDPQLAAIAWRALLNSPKAEEALDRLEALYKELDDEEGLAEVLAHRASRANDPVRAREFAFRAAELRSAKSTDPDAAILAWREFVRKYGPARDVYERMIPLLEQHAAFDELATVLERDAELAEPTERAALLARLAGVRLQLGDARRALVAYRSALTADPHEVTSRKAVEKLLAQGDQRLEAADVLESIYRAEQNHSGLVRVYKARAELVSDPAARLAALAQAADTAEDDLDDPRLGLEVCGLALKYAARDRRALINAWLERFHIFAALAGDPVRRATTLSQALGDLPVDSPELALIARETGEALVVAGQVGRAIETFRRALAYEPGSPELIGRIDQLLAEQGSPEERLALYRSALEQPGDAARRRELLHAIARVQHADLKDVSSAVATWRRLIAEHPSDLTAHEALVEAYSALGETEALNAELERGLEQVQGINRNATLFRIADIAAEQGERERALDIYRPLLLTADFDVATLAAVELLCETQGDIDTLRKVLERRAAIATDPPEQVRTLERLGDVHSENFGDQKAAVEAWRAAAQLSRELGDEPERARRLYERVLNAAPEDPEAAEHLVEAYADANEWRDVPAAFSVLLRGPDAGAAVERLIALESKALAAGALGEYVAMLDEALGRQTPETAKRARELMAARARVLSASPERADEAANAHRGLIETYDRPQDVEAFTAFLKSAAPSKARADDWRWLYEWRVEHSTDAASVLLEWARVEETELRDAPAALRAYERVLEVDPEHLEALRAICRLKSDTGDAEGVLRTLRALRDRGDVGEAGLIDYEMATILVERLRRPVEALDVLERMLEASPGDARALQVARGILPHPKASARAAELLEKASSHVEDPHAKEELLRTLISASHGSAVLKEARPSWYERLAELKESDTAEALGIALEGAEQMPDQDGLWDLAERFARRAQQPAAVAAVHRRVLERRLDAELAERIGQRIVEFHEEWFDEPDAALVLLQRVLELSPRARWALDRVKLTLNSEGRWDELFRLYDHAIEGAADDAEREDLLDEAALAAKDLANDGARAIRYLERLAPMRPTDARIETTLERLYERHGDSQRLIEVLSRRIASLSGRELSRMRSRLASLWLDVGNAQAAADLIDAILEEDAEDDRAYELLERLLPLAGPPAPSGTKRRAKKREPPSLFERAAQRLKTHYAEAKRPTDLVRVLETELGLLPTKEQRVAQLGEIVALRLGDLADREGAFQSLAELVQLEPGNAEHRARLAEVAESISAHDRRAKLLVEVAGAVADNSLERELVREAASVYKTNVGDAARATELYQALLALSGSDREEALKATRELDDLLESSGRSADRCTVLEKMASVEKDVDKKKRVLGEVARLASVELGDPERAARAWRERLTLDPNDLEAFGGLEATLEQVGQWRELVDVLEARAKLREAEDARRDLIRAARLAEQQLADRAHAIEIWKALRERFGPDDDSFEALTALLEHEARWGELAKLLRGAAESARGEQRAELFRMLGELHRDHTTDSLQAVEAFVEAGSWKQAVEAAAGVTDREFGKTVSRRLLDLAVGAWQATRSDAASAPASAAHWAIGSLIKRSLDEGDSERVVELQLRGAELPFERLRRRQLLRDAAWTSCDRLEQSERAIEILKRLFEEDSADEVASASVARFARLLEETSKTTDLAALWEQQARCRAEAGDRVAAAALWARAGDIWEHKLGEADRAIAVHRQGAALGGEASLEALSRLYIERRNYRAAAVSLEWLFGQSTREALAGRALRLADAYVRLGERDRARARLEHAAATAIDADSVRERLAELYREDEAWQPLAELLADEAAHATDMKSRLSRLQEAALLHMHRRGDPAAAIPLLERAAELDPEDTTIRLALSRALSAAGAHDRAAELLRTQVERYGHRKPKDRALVHLALARVSLAAGLRAEALSELDLAAKIDPAHPEILYELSRLALEENQLARAEKTYRALLMVLRRADAGGRGPGRAEVYLDLSEIMSRQGDADRAAEFVESAFGAALESENDARSLERALRAGERFELLARAIEGRLEIASEPAVAARALADLVLLHAERIQATRDSRDRIAGRAERIYRDLEREKGVDESAWTALSTVYEWLGDEAAEARLLVRRVDAILKGTPGPGDAEALYRLAHIRLEDDERRNEGVELLERALELKPDFGRAEELLSAAARAAPRHGGILRLLEHVARTSGREEAIVRAIALSASSATCGSAKVREGVELGRSIGDRQSVLTMLRAALARKDAFIPSDLAWMKVTLSDELLETDEVAEALDLREEAAQNIEPDAGRRLLLDVARLSASRLGDVERAARVYSSLLERDATDREAWEPLLALYRRSGDRERLIALIETTWPLVDSLADRGRLMFEEATLMLEDPAQLEDAIRLLHDLVIEDPSMRPAAELLTEILEREQKYEELSQVIEAQLEGAKSKGDARTVESMSLKLGGMLEKQGQRSEAMNVYDSLLDWKPDSREALRAVVRLSSEGEADPYRLADSIERLLSVEQGDEVVQLSERLIALRTELGDSDGVDRALEIAATADPGNAELRKRLLDRYTERGETAKAAELLARALEAAPDDRELFLRVLEVYQKSGAHDAALDVVGRALERAPSDANLRFERSRLLSAVGRHVEALTDLETAHEKSGRYARELVSALESAIERGDGNGEAHTIRLVDVLEKLGQTTEARNHLSRLLKNHPKNRDALRRLAWLASSEGRWEEASAAYRRLIPLEEGEALVSAAMNLADACERSDRLTDARGGLERALQIAPTHQALRTRLRALYEASGAHRDLARLYLDEAASETKVSARAALLLQAAELLLQKDSDPEEAIDVLEQARSLSPENVKGAVLLARANTLLERSEEALSALQEVVLANRGRRSKELSEVHREIATIHLENGHLNEALDAMIKAFDMDMRNGELAMQLGALALDLDNEEVASRAFRAVTMMKLKQPGSGEGTSAESRAVAYYHLSRIAKANGDMRKARLMASKAVSENPNHEDAQALLEELRAG